jgi:hypothetical protein
MGAASSMCASIATLGATTVYSILVAAGCTAVVLANWSTISGKWNSIIGAFQQSFTQAQSSALTTGFNQAKTSYAGHYTNMTGIDYIIKGAGLNNAANRHIELSSVDKIRKTSNYEIYYSPKNQVALVKFKIGSGVTANVNDIWSRQYSPWEKPNYDLSGATLFVLYGFGTRTIFHAHVRVAGSQFIDKDTELMRKANNLTYKVKPFPIQYDGRYENTTDKPIFGGSQLSK